MTIEELLAVRGPVVEGWRDQGFVTVRYRARGGMRTYRGVLKEDVHVEARLYSERPPLPAPPVLAVDADDGRVLLAAVPRARRAVVAAGGGGGPRRPASAPSSASTGVVAGCTCV